MEKWVQDEQRPEVYYPIMDDMQVMVGISFITNGSPPGELVGTVLYEGNVCRVTLF